MKKIVLTANDAAQIIVDHLVSKGMLKNTVANISWNVDRWNPEKIEVIVEQEDKVTIESGKSYIFSTSDSQLKKYNNTKVEVFRPLTEDECDIADIGNMFKVRFWDGYERDVFEDELVKEEF